MSPIVFHPNSVERREIFFVGGIWNEEVDVQRNASALAEKCNEVITPFWNMTWRKNLPERVEFDAVKEDFTNRLMQSLSDGHSICVIAHSHGVKLVKESLKSLSSAYKKMALERVVAYTFGGVTTIPDGYARKAKNYRNATDNVLPFGRVLWDENESEPFSFTTVSGRGKGHQFIEGYLDLAAKKIQKFKSQYVLSNACSAFACRDGNPLEATSEGSSTKNALFSKDSGRELGPLSYEIIEEESSIPGTPGKTQEAIETLRHYESKDVNINSLIVGLALNLCSSSENIAWGLRVASKQEDPSDKMFIYQQIIAQAPDQLEAYEEIILLTKDPVERGCLFIKAADLAREAQLLDSEADFRAAAKSSFASIVISISDWANAQAIKLPPYPPELQKFLSENCKIWPGKKRSETHIIVPLFLESVIGDAAPTPLILESLDQLDKSAGGSGFERICHRISRDLSSGKEFHYAVMTRDVIPGSRKKSYDDQLNLLPEGYEAPPVFGAALAVLWENRRSGKRLFSNDPLTYTHSKEVIGGRRLIIGGFSPAGLRVYFRSYFADKSVGVAGWREF